MTGRPVEHVRTADHDRWEFTATAGIMVSVTVRKPDRDGDEPPVFITRQQGGMSSTDLLSVDDLAALHRATGSALFGIDTDWDRTFGHDPQDHPVATDTAEEATA